MSKHDLVNTEEELNALADEVLAKSADWMAYDAGGREQFYYINNCHRLIKAYRELLRRERDDNSSQCP
jgi:hypothetical protein